MDVAAFSHLKSLAAEWRAVRETIADAPALDKLIALDYDERDLWPLAQNEALTTVVLKPADYLESLDGIAMLSDLTELEIAAAPLLDDLSELGAQPLRRLWLQDCGAIHSLDAIAVVTSLRSLSVSGCGPIESLGPLTALDHLEVLYAWGSTRVVDGDLTPLTRLPRLAELRMRDREEYRPRVSDINAVVS